MSDLRHRCVFVARFTVINREKGTVYLQRGNCEIEIAPDDIHQRYSEPVIKEEGNPLEVRVYDEQAVNLENEDTLLGDITEAIDRCEQALRAKGYTVVRF